MSAEAKYIFDEASGERVPLTPPDSSPTPAGLDLYWPGTRCADAELDEMPRQRQRCEGSQRCAKEKEDVKDITRKKRKSSKQPEDKTPSRTCKTPGGGNPDRKKEDEAERKRRSKRHCMGDVGICNLPGQGHRESDGESGGESDGDATDPEMPALASLQDEETARRWLRWKEKTCEDALADGIALLMLQERAFCQTGPFCRPQNMTEQEIEETKSQLELYRKLKDKLNRASNNESRGE